MEERNVLQRLIDGLRETSGLLVKGANIGAEAGLSERLDINKLGGKLIELQKQVKALSAVPTTEGALSSQTRMWDVLGAKVKKEDYHASSVKVPGTLAHDIVMEAIKEIKEKGLGRLSEVHAEWIDVKGQDKQYILKDLTTTVLGGLTTSVIRREEPRGDKLQDSDKRI